jgi:hypothetical protein
MARDRYRDGRIKGRTTRTTNEHGTRTTTTNTGTGHTTIRSSFKPKRVPQDRQPTFLENVLKASLQSGRPLTIQEMLTGQHVPQRDCPAEFAATGTCRHVRRYR